MTDTSNTSSDLYPDLTAAGGLAPALVQVARDLGLELGAAPAEMSKGSAGMRCGDHRFWVNTALLERCFMFSGDRRGVGLVSGSTGRLDEVARAAAGWLRGAPVREMRELMPFVRISRLAEAHERGPAEAVEASWQARLGSFDDPRMGRFPRYRALFEAAYAETRLRQLNPVTSHHILWFSACTGFPAIRVGPSIEARENRPYLVRIGGTPIAESDTAEEAVAIAVSHLPADTGPAVAGTAEDLR